MLTFDSAQLTVWLSHYFWPLLRILALISTAPIFSEKQISKKVKIGLGGLIVILIAPTLPASNIPIFRRRPVAGDSTDSDRRGAGIDHAVRLRGGALAGK